MWISNFRSTILTVLFAAFFYGCHSQNYSDLEALGVNCPSRDKCLGYRNNLTYMDRSCECDNKCTAYKDCCIDAPVLSTPVNSRLPVRTDVRCLNYGDDYHTGVYVISKCSRNWSGPRKIREKCIGPDDFRDPLTAVPATDAVLNKTYRNLACAECNYANLASLVMFQYKVACDGLEHLTQEQIFADLTYHQEYRIWGVSRVNRFGNGTVFVGCDLIFDVPSYLNNSVRFCRSDLISTCAPGWHRPPVAELCEKYMAVVYSNSHGYTNPHCAICNHKSLNDISCLMSGLDSRKRPMSFALLLDVNQSDGDQVGMRRVATPECPSGHKYDPFFKKCRQLVCALPGHVVVDGRCVRG